jgi:hypothetical protein
MLYIYVLILMSRTQTIAAGTAFTVPIRIGEVYSSPSALFYLSRSNTISDVAVFKQAYCLFVFKAPMKQISSS